jgi:hypothetical protein
MGVIEIKLYTRTPNNQYLQLEYALNCRCCYRAALVYMTDLQLRYQLVRENNVGKLL